MAVSFDEVFDPQKKPEWLVKWEKTFDAWLADTFCTGIEDWVKYPNIRKEELSNNQLEALVELYEEAGWSMGYHYSDYYWNISFRPYQAPPLPYRRWWSLWLIKR